MGRFSTDPPEDDAPPPLGPDEGDLTPSERAVLDELRTIREQLEAEVPESGEVPF